MSLFKAQSENLRQSSIKILRTDDDTKYKPITRSFPAIIHETTCPYTPQQYGVSERKHRHIVELALAIMAHSSIPTRYWDDVFSSVVYLINRQPSTNNPSSPFYTLFHKPPDYSFLRILGCLCFSYTRPYNDHKLQIRSKPSVFLEYSLTQKEYKCLDIDTNKMFVSRHVLFDEARFPFKEKVPAAASASNSTSSASFSTWLALLPDTTDNPPLLAHSRPTTQNPGAPSLPAESGPSTVFSDPSAVGTDPAVSNQVLPSLHAPTSMSGPSSVVADRAPLLTYSRRTKPIGLSPVSGTPAPGADPATIQIDSRRANTLLPHRAL